MLSAIQFGISSSLQKKLDSVQDAKNKQFVEKQRQKDLLWFDSYAKSNLLDTKLASDLKNGEQFSGLDVLEVLKEYFENNSGLSYKNALELLMDSFGVASKNIERVSKVVENLLVRQYLTAKYSNFYGDKIDKDGNPQLNPDYLEIKLTEKGRLAAKYWEHIWPEITQGKK